MPEFLLLVRFCLSSEKLPPAVAFFAAKSAPLFEGYNFYRLSAMSDTELDAPSGITNGVADAVSSLALTPLAALLSAQNPSPELVLHCGALTLQSFGDEEKEISALLTGAGVYDLGYRGWIEVRGSDRVRWLNGMLTNAVGALPEGVGNYSFLLNAQGRIQGDCYTYSLPDHLLLETDRSQIAGLMGHLDRYIIMDDVELQDVSAATTALGLAGPQASALLEQLGVSLDDLAPGMITVRQARICGVALRLLRAYSVGVPRFELWLAPEDLPTMCQVLLQAGAIPCGVAAIETLRVLEAIPLYGVDILDRDLPQEAHQPRALSFTKGCYLGQEIVERIRSRGAVHRRLGSFRLTGLPPALPAELKNGDQSAGRLTSVASVGGVIYGIGIARSQYLDPVLAGKAQAGNVQLEYEGGAATPLEQPPIATLQS